MNLNKELKFFLKKKTGVFRVEDQLGEGSGWM